MKKVKEWIIEGWDRLLLAMIMWLYRLRGKDYWDEWGDTYEP